MSKHNGWYQRVLAVLTRAEPVSAAQRYVDLGQRFYVCCCDEISPFWTSAKPSAWTHVWC